MNNTFAYNKIVGNLKFLKSCEFFDVLDNAINFVNLNQLSFLYFTEAKLKRKLNESCCPYN